jgi:predicted amidohydrolase
MLSGITIICGELFLKEIMPNGRDEDFPGGGYVFGPDGTCMFATCDWSEGVLYATLAIQRTEFTTSAPNT